MLFTIIIIISAIFFFDDVVDDVRPAMPAGTKRSAKSKAKLRVKSENCSIDYELCLFSKCAIKQVDGHRILDHETTKNLKKKYDLLFLDTKKRVKSRPRNLIKNYIADDDYERTVAPKEILLTELIGDNIYKA